jgi:hypothetical protein
MRRAIIAVQCVVLISSLRAQRPAELGPPTPNAPPLTGVVAGDDGAPVRASITALKLTAPVATGRAESAANGTFTLTGLPDGDYQLCATDPAAVYLDPCAWADAPPRVTIQAGRPATGYRLVMPRGVALPIRVADAGRVLESNAPGRPRPRFAVGVITTRRMLEPASQIAQDGSGRTLRAMVRPGSRVAVLGDGLLVQDAQGRTLRPEQGGSVAVQIPAGVTAVTPVVFSVTGPKP